MKIAKALIVLGIFLLAIVPVAYAFSFSDTFEAITGWFVFPKIDPDIIIPPPDDDGGTDSSHPTVEAEETDTTTDSSHPTVEAEATDSGSTRNTLDMEPGASITIDDTTITVDSVTERSGISYASASVHREIPILEGSMVTIAGTQYEVSIVEGAVRLYATGVTQEETPVTTGSDSSTVTLEPEKDSSWSWLF